MNNHFCKLPFFGYYLVFHYISGIDNIFIIVDAVEEVDPDIQGPERIAQALKHVGGSITMTTITDLVAFAVSTVSDFPAVHLFCVYASLSIFFAYFMIITLFLALLTLDVLRIEKGKRDLCPCCTARNYDPDVNPWEKKKSSFARKVSTKNTRSHRRCSMKKNVLKIFAKSTGSTSARVSLFNKVTDRVL